MDHHDKAYDWAERRKLEVHPTTGAAQLVKIRETVKDIVRPVYVAAKPAAKAKWAKLAKLAKALGDADVIEEDAFKALSGLKSLPFPRPERLGKGQTWRVAMKVIDPRGNEGLRVLGMGA